MQERQCSTADEHEVAHVVVCAVAHVGAHVVVHVGAHASRGVLALAAHTWTLGVAEEGVEVVVAVVGAGD